MSLVTRLKIVVGLSFTIVLIQVVGSAITGSLALLIDTAHAFIDSFGLALALITASLLLKPAKDRYSWGYQRLEVLSAGVQALLLTCIALFGLYEGVRRLVVAEENIIDGNVLIGFGIAGLIVNIIAGIILFGSRSENLNSKAAFIEVLSDGLGSLAVVVSAMTIIFFNWSNADAFVGIGIAVFILVRALFLIKPVLSILLEKTPEDVRVEDVCDYILEKPGVVGIDDIHVSRVSSNLPVISAHIIVEDRCFYDGSNIILLKQLQHDFSDAGDYPNNFNHSTFQLEPLSNLESEKLFNGRYRRHLSHGENEISEGHSH